MEYRANDSIEQMEIEQMSRNSWLLIEWVHEVYGQYKQTSTIATLNFIDIHVDTFLNDHDVHFSLG